MNALIPLHFDASDVRMIMRDGEPWWVLNDICAVLEIANPRHAAKRLRDWQKGVANSDTLGGPQSIAVINESGLYKLVLSSRKSEAERFERWLTTEVLPSIRKWGCYPPPAAIDDADLAAPDPIQPWLGSTPSLRFIEECERIYGTRDFKVLTDRLSHIVSKARLVSILRGDGVSKALRRDDAWVGLLGYGFDLKYVTTGVREYAPDEREAILLLREFPPHQKALAFRQLQAQSERLLASN